MNIYGLIGYPLSHSFSQHYFNNKFNKEGIKEVCYENFELAKIQQLPQLIKEQPNLRGFNVTIPYKEEILPFLDETDEMVKAVGAANCIKLSDNNQKLVGYNTDVYGFHHAFQPLLKEHHNKALILGTGGAAKAVAFVLRKLKIEYLFVSRNSKKNQTINYKKVSKDMMQQYPIIINATPLGMSPNNNACLDIPLQYISQKHLIFDLIYNPEETQLMKWGVKQGATVSNGLTMLQLQAEKSWEIWNQ